MMMLVIWLVKSFPNAYFVALCPRILGLIIVAVQLTLVIVRLAHYAQEGRHAIDGFSPWVVLDYRNAVSLDFQGVGN